MQLSLVNTVAREGSGPAGRLDGAVIADALRAHALLLGTTLRRVLLDRTTRFLQPLTQDSEVRPRVERILAALVGLGDISWDGSLLAPAPLRAMPIEGDGEPTRWLLVGGPPTPRLGMPVETPGLRVVRAIEPRVIQSTVEALGGVITTVDAWSGRAAPVLNAAWLVSETARLEQSMQSADLERGATPRVYLPREARPGASPWRSVPSSLTGSVLVDLHDHGKSGPYAWARFESGRLVAMARLTPDQAQELCFAQDWHADRAQTARFERQGDGDEILRSMWLPRSEFRIVRAFSFLRSDGENGYRIDSREVAWIMLTLVGRLGLRIERTAAPTSPAGS